MGLVCRDPCQDSGRLCLPSSMTLVTCFQLLAHLHGFCAPRATPSLASAFHVTEMDMNRPDQERLQPSSLLPYFLILPPSSQGKPCFPVSAFGYEPLLTFRILMSPLVPASLFAQQFHSFPSPHTGAQGSLAQNRKRPTPSLTAAATSPAVSTSPADPVLRVELCLRPDRDHIFFSSPDLVPASHHVSYRFPATATWRCHTLTSYLKVSFLSLQSCSFFTTPTRPPAQRLQDLPPLPPLPPAAIRVLTIIFLDS